MNNIHIQSILAKLLKKKGIKSYFDLNPEEKHEYDQMEKALMGRELTDKDVEKFFDSLIDELNDKICDPELQVNVKNFYIVELRLARKIKSFLNIPKVQSENAKILIEQQLQD